MRVHQREGNVVTFDANMVIIRKSIFEVFEMLGDGERLRSVPRVRTLKPNEKSSNPPQNPAWIRLAVA